MLILKCSDAIARALGMRFVGVAGPQVLPADKLHMAVMTPVGWFHWRMQ